VTPKPLKLMNGRGGCLRNTHDPIAGPKWQAASWHSDCHGYIAAYSRADAVRMIQDYLGRPGIGLDAELKTYWSMGCWGNSMDGVTPERGIWLSIGRNGKPFRVYPSPEATHD